MERMYQVEDNTLDSLAGFIDTTEAPLTPLGRSEMERYATCPAMARFVELGRVITSSPEADSGTAVHDALAEATDWYVSSNGDMSPADVASECRRALVSSRPDVQPDAIRGLAASVWEWSKFIASMHPGNILRYDGGKANRSGQLSWNLPDLGVCVTSEVDLLCAGPAKELLHEIDYKSGNGYWTAAKVAASFQFAVHGWLILNNYEKISAVEIVIWNTRSNSQTYSVEFTRDRLGEYDARIRQAIRYWLQSRDTEPEQCETWPGVEKCGQCPAAALCPITPPESCAKDPRRFVLSMHAMACALESMEAEAAGYVAQHGPIEVNGLAFGIKPKAERKESPTLYQLER